MNALPEHRRVMYGRTHCRAYDPSDYALAITIAVGLGWWLAMWATA